MKISAWWKKIGQPHVSGTAYTIIQKAFEDGRAIESTEVGRLRELLGRRPAGTEMRPSKLKLAFDLCLGGFAAGTAVAFRPFDIGNGVVLVFGILWIVGAAITLDRHF